MVTRLRRVNPVQFALVTATLYAIIGLIFALLWLPFGAMMAAMPGSNMRMFGAGLGIAVIIVWPIVYFIISFIFGVITAALYNLVAGWTGGIEVTLEQNSPAGVPAGATFP